MFGHWRIGLLNKWIDRAVDVRIFMSDENIKRFLATKPGSLGLADKLKQLEEENAALEAELERVEKNRDAILREKRVLQGRPDKALKGTATELFMTRSASRDPSEYQRMRLLAAEQGKALRIVDDEPAAAHDGPPTTSPVHSIGDADAGILYINSEVRDRVGVARVKEIAVEKGFKEARTFRSARDLPDHLQQPHMQAVVDGENLIGDD